MSWKVEYPEYADEEGGDYIGDDWEEEWDMDELHMDEEEEDLDEDERPFRDYELDDDLQEDY